MNREPLLGKVINWADIPEEVVRPGVRRRSYSTDECMLVMNTVEPDLQVNPHVHDDFDQLVYIIEGRCHYYVDGVPREMHAGSMMLVPAGAEHYIEPIDGVCLNLDIFTPPREDFSHLVSYLHEAGDKS